MRKAYPSDLTDAQWALIEPLIPVATTGRPRIVDIREVLNAVFYLARSGCQWDMLPNDLPARSTVNEYFLNWRDDGTWQRILDALRQEARAPAQSWSSNRPTATWCQGLPALVRWPSALSRAAMARWLRPAACHSRTRGRMGA